jgi:hypothetical protein
MQAETEEFDKGMDAVEDKSIEPHRDLQNEQFIRIDNSKRFIGKKENEQTALKNGIPMLSTVQINQKKQMQGNEVFKSKKKLMFSECEYPKSFSLINLQRHLSHGADADCLALLRILLVLVKNNSSPFSNSKFEKL